MSLGLAAWLATVVGEDAAMTVLALGLAGALLTAQALVQAVLLGLALATSGAAYGSYSPSTTRRSTYAAQASRQGC